MDNVKESFKNRSVLVLGMGASGHSAADFLLCRSANVYAYDRKSPDSDNPLVSNLLSRGMNYLEPHLLPNVQDFDLLVVSPGISPLDPTYQSAVELGIEIVGEAELALRQIAQPCIGITGTNGKTTVTSLIAHVLNYHGIAALAVGNIGVPLTSLFSNSLSSSELPILVIELSSFQLETMHTKVLDVAILLNITPDHLDRYATMKEYAKAKMRIFDCLKSEGKYYLSEQVEITPPKTGQMIEIDIADRHCIEKERENLHDVDNSLSAYAACSQFGITVDQFTDALNSFTKPPHRIEFVRESDGITYIDDSKGTNIDAVIKSVKSMKGPVILIAGGVDKGFSYQSWSSVFDGKVRLICTIGQAASKIEAELSAIVPTKRFETLDEAVLFASKYAIKGDAVLLSPGCASYDMFTDYAHRGREFKRIVNLL